MIIFHLFGGGGFQTLTEPTPIAYKEEQPLVNIRTLKNGMKCCYLLKNAESLGVKINEFMNSNRPQSRKTLRKVKPENG